jgi:hypothetical protein
MPDSDWMRQDIDDRKRAAQPGTVGPRNGPQSLFEVFDFFVLPGGPYWI